MANANHLLSGFVLQARHTPNGDPLTTMSAHYVYYTKPAKPKSISRFMTRKESLWIIGRAHSSKKLREGDHLWIVHHFQRQAVSARPFSRGSKC